MLASRTVIAVIIALTISPHAFGDAIRWAPDIPSAKRAASESNRLVLLHFWGDHCPPCRAVDQNVFARESVGQMLGDFFVPVKVNGSQQPDLATLYGVDRWPTDVIMTADGRVLKKMISPQDPQQYVAMTTSIARRWGDESISEGRPDDEGNIAQAGFFDDQKGFSTNSGFTKRGPSTWQKYADEAQQKYDQELQQLQNGGTQVENSTHRFAQNTQNRAANLQSNLPSNGQAVTNKARGDLDPGLASFRDQLNSKVRNGAQNFQPTQDPMQQVGQQVQGVQQGLANTAQQTRSQLQGATPAVQGKAKEIINQFAKPATNTPPAQPNGDWPQQQYSENDYPAPNAENAPAYSEGDYSGGDYAAGDYNQQTEDYAADPGYEPVSDWPTETATQPEQHVQQPTQEFAASPRGNLNTVQQDRPIDDLVREPDQDYRTTADSQHTDWNRQMNAGIPVQRKPMAAPVQEPTKAMDGFCPVTLANQNTWQSGDPRWGAVHRGKIYLFAGQDQQREFLSDPDRFSPVLSGLDPVELTLNNRPIPGIREHGVFYRNQIYLFSSEQSLQQFWSAPEKYAGPIRQAMQAGTVGNMVR